MNLTQLTLHIFLENQKMFYVQRGVQKFALAKCLIIYPSSLVCQSLKDLFVNRRHPSLQMEGHLKLLFRLITLKQVNLIFSPKINVLLLCSVVIQF